VTRWTNLAIASAAVSGLNDIEVGLRCLLLVLSIGGLVWTWLWPAKPPTCPLSPKAPPPGASPGAARAWTNN